MEHVIARQILGMPLHADEKPVIGDTKEGIHHGYHTTIRKCISTLEGRCPPPKVLYAIVCVARSPVLAAWWLHCTLDGYAAASILFRPQAET